MERRKYRVAQWATGNVGLRSLKTIIEHPDFELVGLKVYSPDKAGTDAGELCGVPSTGVIATLAGDEVIAAKPDCVVYMPHEVNVEELCTILAAGINVATSRMEFNGRDRMDQALRERVEEACRRGNSSIYANGSTPGWFLEVMPLALSALERRVDCVTLTDFSDLSSRNSPDMLFEVIGFGKRPEDLDPHAPIGTAMSSPPSLGMTSAALGLPADEIVTGREFALTRERIEIVAGTVEAGTIGAVRMEITAMHQGRPVLRRRSTWYITRDVDPAWDLRDTGLHYQVEGDLPMDVMITFPVAPEDYPKISPGMTAHPVVNSIPYVCEAAPGILQTSELPIIVGRF